MKNSSLATRMYLNPLVRIPTKFIVLFSVTKVVYDYLVYLNKWRTRNTQPRFCSYDKQSPVAPELPKPYPYPTTYQQFQIKQFNRINNGTLKTIIAVSERYMEHSDLPCRENIHAIDRLMFAAKEYTTSENVKYHLLSELAQKEGEIPVGVFRQIRELHQDQLQVNAPIIPTL